MLDLALAWRDDRDAVALGQLARYLDAWIAWYRSSVQSIEETPLGNLIVAFRLTAANLPAATARRSRAFIKTLAEGYLQQMAAQRGDAHGVWSNNWQSHRIKLATLATLATLAAGALDNRALFARARAAFVAQLSVNRKADGEVLDFAERDALHFIVYDLEPLVLAAAVAQGRGEDWLRLPGREGQTLAKARDWLLPYAQGQRSHEKFRKTRVRFDVQRAEAGLPGYAGRCEPQGARTFSLLDPRYAAVARQLAATPPRMLWAYAPARND